VLEERNVIQTVRAEVMSDRPEFRAYSLGRHNLGDGIDPFIQLDHFYMRAPIFPPHPHAGFSAVTYLFEDSEGRFKIGIAWEIVRSSILAICIGLRRGVA
jgi:redox-sensitive bicupin YhaK (pirin superfamily)